MKPKTILFFAILITSASAFTGCKKIEGCTDGEAWNFDSEATHDDGSCVYSNPIKAGTWNVSENCQGSIFTHTITITKTSNTVTIVNLGDFNPQLTVTGNAIGNNLTIPSQLSGNAMVSGSGVLAGNTLTINYTVSQGGSTTCTATCTQ